MEPWLQASWITTIGWGESAECLLVRMDTLTETKSQSMMSDAVLTTNACWIAMFSLEPSLQLSTGPQMTWSHSGYPAFTEKAGT